MNALQERILRACLKPAVECDLPGRLRLRFSKADRLPEQALPYLHYIPEVMQLLPGVGEVSYNVRIGTVLVKYDAQKVSAARILEWIGAVVDEGVALAGEGAWQASDEERLRALALERLKRRVSRF